MYRMNSEQQKNSSHILIMKNDIKTIDNLSHTKALRYIDRKLYEYTSKKSWDTINKSFYIDSIKQLRQKTKEINKNIAKLENTNNLLNNIFDENKALKEELKALRKEHKEKTEKIKRMKTAQLINYKKKREQSIKKIKENNKALKNKIKEHDLYKKKQEIREQKKINEYEVHLNVWGYPEKERRKTARKKNNRDIIEYKGLTLYRMFKNMKLYIKANKTFYDRFNNKNIISGTNDFDDILPILDDDEKGGFNVYYDLINYYGYLITVQIEKVVKPRKTYDPVNTDLHDNINNHSMFFKYIEYEPNKNAKTFAELINSNEDKHFNNSCYVDILYDTYKDSVQKKISKRFKETKKGITAGSH